MSTAHVSTLTKHLIMALIYTGPFVMVLADKITVFHFKNPSVVVPMVLRQHAECQLADHRGD
jgi:hypothetical protein